MKRRLVSGLLAASMVFSLMPVSALAEGEDGASAEVVSTVVEQQEDESGISGRNAEMDEIVGVANYVLETGELYSSGSASAEDAIDQAQKSEAEAALEAGVSGEPDAAKAEAKAILKQDLAQKNLDSAEEIIEDAESETEQKAADAADAADAAKGAKDETEKQQDAAEQAAQKADEALEDAKEADSKEEAEQAADEAEKQSDAAASTAADAVIKSDEAARMAADAEAAYNEAKAAADEANARVQALLKGGVEQMDEAQKAAADAQKLAKEKYQEMLAAKAAADAAAETAKQESDAAKAELDAASKSLAETIKEQGKNVAEKGAVATATGAALVATKAAVEVAKVVVNNYEGEIQKLEQQIGELKSTVDEAQKAIDEAQAKLNALDETDADYPKAKAELEAATAAQNEAQKVYENAQAIIDARNAAQADGTAGKKSTADTMKDLQNSVSNGTATDEEKQKLTELVLENINTYDKDVKFEEIYWVDGHSDIFYIKDAEGNRTYYQLQVGTRDDGTKYLQYYGTTYVPEAAVPDLYDGLEKTEYAVEGETRYKASIDGKEYDVSIVKSTLFGKEIYQYQVDGHTLTYNPVENQYYYNAGSIWKPKYVYVILKDPARFDSADTPITTNSNTITEMWEQADNAEQNLEEASNHLQTAQKKFNEVEKQYNETKTALKQFLAEKNAEKESVQDQIDVLKEEKEDKEHTLNGGLGDQLLRSVIEGDGSALADAGKEIAALEVKAALLGGLSEEEQKKLDELKGSVKTTNQVAEIIVGVSDGSIDQEDLEKVVNLVKDNNFSVKTQKALAEKLEGLLEKQYENATENLQKAVETAQEEIEKQTEAAGKAALNAAEKEVALAQAQVKQGLANQGVDQAEKFLASAEKAAEDAQAAYEAYVALANSLNVDRAAVEAAKAAYEQAQKDADTAKALADQALLDAENAKAAATAARKIADEFPELTKTKGEEIADYAQSLLGYSDHQMTNPAFAEQVFRRYGYPIDLSSRNAADVLRNGIQVENSEVEPGDLICILAEDGTVSLFGVYYKDGIYIFYNELTKKVETGRCMDAPYGWIAIRIVK